MTVFIYTLAQILRIGLKLLKVDPDKLKKQSYRSKMEDFKGHYGTEPVVLCNEQLLMGAESREHVSPCVTVRNDKMTFSSCQHRPGELLTFSIQSCFCETCHLPRIPVQYEICTDSTGRRLKWDRRCVSCLIGRQEIINKADDFLLLAS